MNDTEYLDYLEELIRDKPNINFSYNKDQDYFLIQSNYLQVPGKTFRQAIEVFKLNRDRIREKLNQYASKNL